MQTVDGHEDTGGFGRVFGWRAVLCVRVCMCVCVDLGRGEARRGGVIWCGRGYVTSSEVGCGVWDVGCGMGIWSVADLYLRWPWLLAG
jgi:hypothetical protein